MLFQLYTCYSNSAHVLTCVCMDTCSVPALRDHIPTPCGCSGGSMLFNYQRPKVLQIDAVGKRQRKRERRGERERERDWCSFLPPGPASDVPLGLINPVKSHLFSQYCSTDWSPRSAATRMSRLRNKKLLTNKSRVAGCSLGQKEDRGSIQSCYCSFWRTSIWIQHLST